MDPKEQITPPEPVTQMPTTQTPASSTPGATQPVAAPAETTATTTAPSATPPAASTPPASSSTPPTPPVTKHRLSMKTVILIAVLALLTGVLLFIALRPMQKPIAKQTPVPTVTPSPAHSILSMALEQIATPSSIPSLQKKTVDVLIDSASNKVDGVQFDISYDPTVLTNVSVASGSFFPNPVTLLSQVDSKNGKIHYALGIQATGTPVTGKGTVALITFSMLPTTQSTTTKLSFLPKTQVIQQGTLGSVLLKAVDLTITTDALSPKPSSSTSSAQ